MTNIIQKMLAVKGMTQAELARRIGIKREYMNKIINGHVTPAVSLALKIARVLDVRVEDIFPPIGVVENNSRLHECQNEIIDFLLTKGINFSELLQAVCINEQEFVDCLLRRTNQITLLNPRK